MLAALAVALVATGHLHRWRDATVDGWKAFAGQLVLEPSQVSATSQTPAEERHTVDEGLNASVGQGADEPVQFSALSHTPAALRHTVALG